MKNKYNLTVEENIFVAKRNLVDNIYRSAKLEGLAITYPDTETIINGGKIQGLTTDEVVTINNLKHAWQFILETTDYPTDFGFIQEINRKVGTGLFYTAGEIRKVPVSVGGTKWKPPEPNELETKEEIAETLKIKNPTERSIELILRIMRRQIFIDGNKRTGMLAGNHQMICNGCGIITIPEESITEFFTKLLKYYENNEINEVKDFVYEIGIDGIHMNIENGRY